MHSKKLFLTMCLSALFPIAAFATGQTFNDVPSGNWTYGAVSQLQKDGIVDNSIQSEKLMNRYEFAVLVVRCLDKYDQANVADQKIIDSLSAEFASELNHMGVREAKIQPESKIKPDNKVNVFVGGDTRMRYVSDSPGHDIPKLHGSDRFDFRQRIKFWGTINNNMSWTSRISTNAQNKWGNYDQTSGSDISLDVMNITMKKVFGLDSIRLGRSPVDFFSYGGLVGRPGNADGVTLNKNFNQLQFTGWFGNVKSDTNQGTGSGDSGDARSLGTAQLTYDITKKFEVKSGYYWADIPGTSNSSGTGTLNTNVGNYDRSNGLYLGFNWKLGGVTVLADYLNTHLVGAANIPTNPQGWVVQVSNGKGPGATQVFYPVLPFVRIGKVGDSAFMASYRSIDAGTVPSSVGGFDTTAVSYAPVGYSTYTHGTDNVNALYLAYENVLAKNFVLSLEYQNVKIKDKSLTGLTSDNLDKTYQLKFEFFY
ncbi:hypothetical protein NXG27_05920 [Megasphaera paucivorans]|uniref:SLH domain-containing protein n=1 Tax=Megasphaera paucivorans TaxID=349095 RepID=A0A1H0B7T7_9FIRM|nr:hypothetical protein [Megasphaera paucivorans]SDN41727.1 hypothetical protein SAMN05660299_02687 [Megasphaera paucivorans]